MYVDADEPILFQHCPETSVQVLWEDWWVAHLLWPLAVQISLTIIFQVLVRPLYKQTHRASARFRTFVKEYIGTPTNQKVLRSRLLLVLYSAQIVSSCISVIVWVNRTYARRSQDGDRVALQISALVDLLNWAVNRLRGEGLAISLWELNGVVDALTLVPTLRCGMSPDSCGAGVDWLSLLFLRSFSLPFNFRRIRETGCLRNSPERILVLMQLVLRVLCLLFVMAGSIFTCELLGDPEFLVDSCVLTAHGQPVSVAQMIYWIVISVTTVGYGDFAPKAMISRMLTALFIVYGIANVFVIQFTFIQLWTRYREGSGSYQPWNRETPHIVVILGVRGHASQLSSMVAGFLQEVLHPAHCSQDESAPAASTWRSFLRDLWRGDPSEASWPNVVILSPSLWDDEKGAKGEKQETFEEFLQTANITTEARRKVWFLVGKATDQVNLQRAAVGSCALTFILTDMKSLMPDDDDGQNIYTAMLVQKMYPSVQLRVMLTRPESKSLAVQAGIEPSSCFSGRELAAHMLAQNVRCHGLLPVITGLFKSWDVGDVEQFLAQVTADVHTQRLRKKMTMLDKGRSGSFESHVETAELSKITRLTRMVKTRGGHSLRGAAGSPRTATPLRASAKGDEAAPVRGEVRRASYTSPKFSDQEEAWLGDSEMSDFWMSQYFHGLAQGVYGFALAERYDGLTFGEVTHAIFMNSGAIVIAVMDDDRLLVCPQRTRRRPLRAGQICFAVASGDDELDACRKANTSRRSWRRTFLANRDKARKQMHREGVHVSAAKVMGHQIRRRIDSRRELLTPNGVGNGDHHPSQALNKTWPPAGTNGHVGPLSPMMSRRRSSGELDCCTPVGPEAPSPSVYDLRRGLTEDDELTLVVVCHGEEWQQVRTFVESLRAPFQPTMRPVIIMAPTPPPPEMLRDIGGRCAYLNGSCLSAEDLVDAGMLEARAVVVMSGTTPSAGQLRESLLRDYRVVLTSQELECWCGFLEREIFTAYELLDSQSVSYLPLVTFKRRSSLEDVLEEADKIFLQPQVEAQAQKIRAHLNPIYHCRSKHSAQSAASHATISFNGASPRSSPRTLVNGVPGDTADLSNSADSTVSPLVRNVSTGTLALQQAVQDTKEMEKDSIILNQRFAAGQVFSPEVFGTMLGRMFYMPAIIELVEAPIMPHVRRQRAFTWQMRIPPNYVGQSFGDLFRDLSLEQLLPNLPESLLKSAAARREEGSQQPGLSRRASAGGRTSWMGPLAEDEDGEASLASPVQDEGVGEASDELPGRVSVVPDPDSPTNRRASLTVPSFAPPSKPPATSSHADGAPAATKPLRNLRQAVSLNTVHSATSEPCGVDSSGTYSKRLKALGPAVPIALYRARDEDAEIGQSPGTGGRNFSCLAPFPQQRLRKSDWVTVLGSELFGKRLHELGLLRGAPSCGTAPAAEGGSPEAPDGDPPAAIHSPTLN